VAARKWPPASGGIRGGGQPLQSFSPACRFRPGQFWPLERYGSSSFKRRTAPTRSLARLEARLAADVHALLKRAAEIQGRTLTDFVVAAARDAACRAIEETEIVRLSVEDQRALAEAILHPPDPTRALRRAFRRRRDLFGNR
jgi:uncharacterized protein (DUF1778 family)